MKKVVIGMSGGVDSSVAALLLQQQGYEVIGLFMRNWDSATNNDILGNPTIDDEVCTQEQDYNDALRVCKQLGIELHRVDFIEEYWNHVFTYFLDEYKKGRTPNPDILCNKFIKFDAFSEHAKKFNPDFIAMGHYARVKRNGKIELLRGIDNNKDQTYFLSQLTSKQLSNVLFPIGDIDKSEVRRLALEYNLFTKDKKDSTGICFIGERDFNKFLNNYLPAKSGDMITEDSKIIAKHGGLMYYTIGQRKGLGIGGSKEFGNEPWFVIGKNLKTNQLIVGQGYHHPTLYSDSCDVVDVNFINEIDLSSEYQCTAKFRYRQSDNDVVLKVVNNKLVVEFVKPIRAVTPGQAVVFYRGDVCLGGGFIDQVFYKNEKRLY